MSLRSHSLGLLILPVGVVKTKRKRYFVEVSQYIAERVDDQIDWYDRKSLSNHRWYKRLRTTQLIAAALIPFLTGYLAPEMPATKVVVGLFGAGIAVITATLDLYKFQEHWIQYRTVCESLKKEKYLFLTNSGPYGTEPTTDFQTLVQRVEALISKENSSWAQHVRGSQESEKKSG